MLAVEDNVYVGDRFKVIGVAGLYLHHVACNFNHNISATIMWVIIVQLNDRESTAGETGISCSGGSLRLPPLQQIFAQVLTISLPHGINKKLKCETKNKMMSVIGPVQSRYREAVQKVKEIYGWKDLLKR